MARCCARLLRLLAVVLVIAGGVSLAATRAQAATPSGSGVVITAFSAPGDFVGSGKSAEFDGVNAKITGTATSSAIRLTTGEPLNPWSFLIAPPRGSTFRVGYFAGAQTANARAQGHPGLEITGDGHGCDAYAGSVEVRDIKLSGTKVVRLDLLYTQYCDNSPGALFGEIRINEPQPAAGLLVSSSSITWPSTGSGGPTPVPVVIRNRGAGHLAVSSATVTGPAKSEFRVAPGRCVGTALAPGASCSFLVSFTQAAAGPQSASLAIKTGTVTSHVQLDAPMPPGTTSLTTVSGPGDLINGGHNYDFNDTNSGIFWTASPTEVVPGVTVDGQRFYSVNLTAAPGRTLKAGATYPVSASSGNKLTVEGPVYGCDAGTGSFSVKQAVFDGAALEHFDATFTVQSCADGTDSPDALTGELKYQSAPVVSAPPKVSDLTATRHGTSVALGWKNPADSGYRSTIVRVEQGRPAGVGSSAGTFAYQGTGHAAALSGLSTAETYTAVVYTVDQYGNVSAPAELAVTG